MNSKLKYFMIAVMSLTALPSCKKDKAPAQLNPFYRLKVNGSSKAIDACGSTDYVAEYLRDTAVWASFGCAGQRAGFYLKGKISDGTYILDNINNAWYYEGTAFYSTDSVNKGTLTITTKYFQTGSTTFIPTVEGTFSFDAVDKKTGQKIVVSSGKYLLKKEQF